MYRRIKLKLYFSPCAKITDSLIFKRDPPCRNVFSALWGWVGSAGTAGVAGTYASYRQFRSRLLVFTPYPLCLMRREEKNEAWQKIKGQWKDALAEAHGVCPFTSALQGLSMAACSRVSPPAAGGSCLSLATEVGAPGAWQSPLQGEPSASTPCHTTPARSVESKSLMGS